ncbi:MAG: hypothetical protein AAGD22_03375 [Verrucomicrobiota bacterium]
MSEFKELERLLRLKKYEQPREGYYEDFVVEFQRRQRAELLSRSSRSLFFERLGTYASGFSKQTWFAGAGAGLAYACVMAYLMISPGKEETKQASVESSAQPVDLWRVNNLSLDIVPAGADETLRPVTGTGTLSIDPVQPMTGTEGFLDF